MPPELARLTIPLGLIGKGSTVTWPTAVPSPVMEVTLICCVWLPLTNVATKVPRLSALLTIAAFSTSTVPSR